MHYYVFILVLLFLTVPWVDLQYVIVVFPDHTHLLVYIQLRLDSKLKGAFSMTVHSVLLSFAEGY